MKKKRRIKKPDSMIPTASMGDIAFLLIIFFVLCSNFAKKAGKEMVPPAAVNLVQLPKPRFYVAIDKNQKLYFQGRETGSASEIEADIQNLIDPNGSEEARTVIFECDKEIPKEQFEPVLEAIAKAGGIIGAVGKEGVSDPTSSRRAAE